MSKAKNSPLRDYMLKLYKLGIKVTFYEGRPENPADRSQMFFVEIPKGYSIEQHVDIIRNIHIAIKASAEMDQPKERGKLDRQTAMDYVKRLALFKEQSGHN